MGADADRHPVPVMGLVLYAVASGVGSERRVQRLLFLTSNALPGTLEDPPGFEARDDGPYSREVHDVLTSLEGSGCLTLPDCALTERGRELSHDLVLPEPLKGVTDLMARIVTGTTDDELLLMIGVDHLGYRPGSKAWGDLMGRRFDIAYGMFLRGRISIGRAAELAGVSEDEFMEDMRRDGVRWRDALRDPVTTTRT